MKPTIATITTFVFLLLLTVQCAKNTTPEKSEPPNVIVILTDDQGWGDLSFNGNTNLSTPNIDTLAMNGASFSNFFVQPVCSPTRAELLTGVYHTKLGVYATSAGGERMKQGVETIAQVFKNEGYATAAYGKWHNGMQPPYHPNSRGFDDFYGFCSGHWGNYFSPMLEHNGEIVGGNGFLVDDLFDRGIEFVKKNKEQPFLLTLPVNTPHSPMQVPDAYWSKFKDKDLLMKSEREEDENFTRAALAMVENIDWNVGRLMAFLKDNGQLENTIVVYLSDNGPNSDRWNGGLRGRKGSTDEGGVKTSCFIHWPKKIAKGTTIEQLAGAIDLLPTLTKLAGIQSDMDEIDGTDLSDIVLGTSQQLRSRALFNHWNGKTSVRTQKYRLDFENRLYDMVHDKAQTQDISEQNSSLRDSLVQVKEAWELEALGPILTKEFRPFTLGDPKLLYTQIPARDGEAHGNIKRSNRWPNDSFYTNWKSPNDSITWDVEVLEEGEYQVELYYTASESAVGSVIELKLNDSNTTTTISEAHDPPLKGMENDRYPRMESYVKDFTTTSMGTLQLEKGKGTLVLKANELPGNQTIDFRLLQFKRISE
ncbi:MAG: N-acetylgalactosamine 6-sulfate sulfatase [Allomuricauda sp.]|nr:MAG: N-acetylgalactosamine 6-sulfate sulfatase [Allomuricauda sp.]